MNTRADIETEQRIDISLGVIEVDVWNHDAIARKVIFTDVEGNRIPLTVFHNNDCASREWEVGHWYRLEDATGDSYEDQIQLKPSWDFEVTELDDEPDQVTPEARQQLPGREPESAPQETSNTEATTGGGPASRSAAPGTADSVTADESLESGPYLLHFPFGELPELEVHAYRLEVPGGISEQDDIDGGVLGFTARVASRFRYQSGAPVTTDGPLCLYTVDRLYEEVEVGDYTVKPEHTGTETLEARSYDDRESLRELVKQDIKAALQGTYDVRAINEILELNPCMEADSGDFTATREYKCRVWVDPDGTVICGVNVGYHLASTFSAAEYVERGFDVEGVNVEHDTDVYEREATGVVRSLEDVGYTDYVDEMGSSTADYHRNRDCVEPETIERVAANDPLMATIDYRGHEGLQALEYCRVVPTLNQLKLVDEPFHQQFQLVSRMDPDERFDAATSFVDSMGATPSLGLDPVPTPTNECYAEISVDTKTANMRFDGGRTASYGARGLDDYGVHQPPESFDLLALYPDDYEEDCRDFVRRLLKKLNDFEAPPSSLTQQSYSLGSEFEYARVAGEVEDVDGVFAVVPDRDWIQTTVDVDDPYPEFKQQFAQEKIPSQMVQYSNLDRDAYLGNIAAGLVAKCGGIPWRVHEVPGESDVFVGLDVTYDHDTDQHVGASANVVLADGTILASEAVSIQQGETFEVDDVVGIVKNLLKVYVKEEGTTPDHVVVHRDGQFYLDVEELVSRLDSASELIPKFDLVEIRKSGNPRIASYSGGEFETAPKGTAFESTNADHAYLATTGSPERVPGTPRPIRVVKRRGPTDLGTLTSQIYWLSEAHVGSISRSTRLPITTYYADRCADHASQGYMLSGELVRGVPYI